jgi:hypothetical protein
MDCLDGKIAKIKKERRPMTEIDHEAHSKQLGYEEEDPQPEEFSTRLFVVVMAGLLAVILFMSIATVWEW